MKTQQQTTVLNLKMTDTIDMQLYCRLGYPEPQPTKLYTLPKLHKPNNYANVNHSLVLWISHVPALQTLKQYS